MPRRPSPSRRRQAGFSLLEAVVAIVLIATSGMALFAWINSNLITLGRVQDVNARTEATQNALEYMGAVNPMLTPTGRTTLGNYGLSWEARQATPLKDGTGYPAGVGLWQFALYETEVALAQDDGQPWFSFRLKQIGYKRVRSIGID